MSLSNAKTLTTMSEHIGSSLRPCLWICTGASPQIGFGHLRRCIVLAKILSDYCNPLFILDPDDLWSRKQLESLGFDYCSLKLRNLWSFQPRPSAILLDTRLPEGLNDLIATAQEKDVKILSIHDLGLNPLPSNIAIDGSISPLSQGDVPSTTKIFKGTDFMVLDPAFRHLHQRPKIIRKEIGSIFINLGGGDSRKYYFRVLEGIKRWAHEVEVTGLRGFVDWSQDSLNPSNGEQMRLRWESGPAFQHIEDADLAITAGGLSAYEALCAGVPLIALAYDEFQQKTITSLESAGGCINLGAGDALDPMRFTEILSGIELDRDMRVRLSCIGRSLVDGLGGERVSQIIRQSIRESETASHSRRGE
jgi:spore coat polysaccharide biosynthesis predicted glycosyltransferase SpsG